jgi:hypothetical protein
MKYAVEMGSSATIYIPSFEKSGSGIKKFMRGDSQTHRQRGDRISLLRLIKADNKTDHGSSKCYVSPSLALRPYIKMLPRPAAKCFLFGINMSSIKS